MNRVEIYDAWVPANGLWSLWAKPTLFGQMPVDADGGGRQIGGTWDALARKPQAAMAQEPWHDISVDWAPAPVEKAILIVDLPDEEAVHLALNLARRGYRPVPLYNGCTGPAEVIDQRAILAAIRAGSAYLTGLALPDDAPPVFLLDSRRLSRPVALRAGMLDNRWRVYPEDFPSAELLRKRGISRIVLVSRHKPLADLATVLTMWQEEGIPLESKNIDSPDPPHPLTVPRIPWYRRLASSLSTILGLRRSPVSGFGYIVREPSHG